MANESSPEVLGWRGRVHQVLFWFRLGIFIVAALGALILLGEGIRVYQTAYAIHPWASYGTLGLFALGLVFLLYPVKQLILVPRVVEPPSMPPGDAIRLKHLRRECGYLRRYLKNAGRNPELADRKAEIALALSQLAEFERRIRLGLEEQARSLRDELDRWSEQTLQSLLRELDQRVDRLIHQEALAVGLATAVSPNGLLDAFVMLWRSIRVVTRIAVCYYGRPGVLGTVFVCRDVSVATALAGFLQSFSESLGNVVARSVGGVTGVVAGPAMDGVTNALVLARVGYLAKERCRALRSWDGTTRKSALLHAVHQTQKMAVGLTTEILRQVGGGLTTVADEVRVRAMDAAGAVVDSVSDVAESAMRKAGAWTDAVRSAFRTKRV